MLFRSKEERQLLNNAGYDADDVFHNGETRRQFERRLHEDYRAGFGQRRNPPLNPATHADLGKPL